MNGCRSEGGRTLLLVAVEEELGAAGIAALSGRCDTVFTGVGKLRAFEAAAAALARGDYRTVINAGTCGSLRHAAGTVLRPSAAVQGDVYLDSIFATEPEATGTGDEGVSILSSDNFIGPDAPAEVLGAAARYDCFDMESYAIARAVKFHAALHGGPAPRLRFVKAVSDNADGTAEEWETRLARVRPALLRAIDEALAEA